MKAYFIDATARTVAQVDYETVRDLHKLIDGYIQTAATTEAGDVLYVDEEGLLKPKAGFFRWDDRETPLAGSGVLVGAEQSDDEGEYLGTAPPAMTLFEAAAKVRFMDRAQVEAWGKANASDVASFIATDGKVAVTGHIGELYGNMPKA